MCRDSRNARGRRNGCFAHADGSRVDVDNFTFNV
jgi:hypothetical protein